MLRIEADRMLRSGSCRVVALVAYEERRTRRLPAVGRVSDERGEFLTATPKELERWHAAAITYLGAVAAAEAELQRADSRWRRRRWRAVRWLPFVKGRVERQTGLAQERYLHLVREAGAAYQPSLRQVERRLVEYETARREHARQQWERQQARQRAAEEEFEAWQRGREAFTAAADLSGWGFVAEPDGVRVEWRATGSLTARELAAKLLAREDGGLGRQVWDASARAPVETIVGAERFDEWWDNLRATVRNCHARDQAIQAVVDAIRGTSAALEAAGRPGISRLKEKPIEPIEGWKVDVDWSQLPEAAPSDSPPRVPVCHLEQGEWYFGMFKPSALRAVHRSIIVDPGWRPNEYRIAHVASHDMAGYGTQYRWRSERPAEFAESLFRDEVSYHERSRYSGDRCTVSLTEHADPGVYVPYAQAVAGAIVQAVTTLVPTVG